MVEKNLKNLYDKVSAKFDIGTYDSFKAKMQTRQDRKKFHDKVSQKFDIGTFESMEIKLMGTGCLSRIKQYAVAGKPNLYKFGNTNYKYYSTGQYRSWDSQGNRTDGTWACNSKGFIELNGIESSLGGTQRTTTEWIAAPTKEEVKSGKKVLKSGMMGPFVKEVQNMLKTKGFNPGRPDSKFGGNTKTALKNFQKSVNLKDDGIIGKDTFAALFFIPELPKFEKQLTPLSQQGRETPGVQDVFTPSTPEIKTQQTVIPPLTPAEERKFERMTRRETRRNERMARRQQNAHVDPQPTIKESMKTVLKKTLTEKQQEKENLMVESKIITNRFSIITEGVILETEKDQIRFVEDIIVEMNYLVDQGYSSKVINEGLFSMLGSLLGGSAKSVPAVFGEYIAKWLTSKLGVPKGSFIEAAIVTLVGNLNIADYDKFFTDCRFASNKIADSIIEAYLFQMQQKTQSTSEGASGFIVSALRNAVSEYFLEDKEGIIQQLQDKLIDFICPKLGKIASSLSDTADNIKDKAMA